MTQEINRKLHEALGKKPEFIETSLTTAEYVYPDYYSDPRLVIEAMREKEDFHQFLGWLGGYVEWIGGILEEEQIPIDLIMDKTGKLAKLATEWIERSE